MGACGIGHSQADSSDRFPLYGTAGACDFAGGYGDIGAGDASRSLRHLCGHGLADSAEFGNVSRIDSQNVFFHRVAVADNSSEHGFGASRNHGHEMRNVSACTTFGRGKGKMPLFKHFQKNLGRCQVAVIKKMLSAKPF